MAIHPVHASAIAGLPHHHRDPFDRALLAHAPLEPLTLQTQYERLTVYGEYVLVI